MVVLGIPQPAAWSPSDLLAVQLPEAVFLLCTLSFHFGAFPLCSGPAGSTVHLESYPQKTHYAQRAILARAMVINHNHRLWDTLPETALPLHARHLTVMSTLKDENYAHLIAEETEAQRA